MQSYQISAPFLDMLGSYDAKIVHNFSDPNSKKLASTRLTFNINTSSENIRQLRALAETCEEFVVGVGTDFFSGYISDIKTPFILEQQQKPDYLATELNICCYYLDPNLWPKT